MKQYHDFLEMILQTGTKKEDRTGTGTISTFVPPTMRFDLGQGFPLLTTKKVHWKSIVHELIWFLRGDTNIKYLKDNDVSIWDEWADENGDLGPVYGYQWRNWGGSDIRRQGIDQITDVIQQIKDTPDSRRLIVTAWNPADIPYMALPPCHMMFQFYTREIPWDERKDILRDLDHEINVSDEDDDYLMEAMEHLGVPYRYLDCHLYQRSADAFLGVPFNIASYALLTHLIAREVGMAPGVFNHTCGDAHIYLNHMEQVDELLSRTEAPALPWLGFSNRDFTIDNVTFEDIQLINYNPLSAIKAPVAV